mgnify:FL=1
MKDYLEKQPIYDEEILITADGAYNSVANTKTA